MNINALYESVIEDLNNSGYVKVSYIVIVSAITSIFFLLKWLLTAKRECRKRFSKKKKVSKSDRRDVYNELFTSYFLEFFISCGIAYIFVVILKFNGIFIGPTLGILISYFIENKVIGKDDIARTRIRDSVCLDDTKDENSIENDNKEKEAVHIDANPDVNFYNPSVWLKEGMTVDRLSICDILEIYGYISPNQIYKMISSSIFETPDEQINRLLEMTALEPDELKEARAIFNLIRLKKRLVTKDEALNYLIDLEKSESNKKK